MSALRVMIVEDEPIIAEDIADMLRHMDADPCWICYTLKSAFDSLEENQPDLLLIDINLGRGNEGIELAETINQQHRIPFLFLTSYSDRLTLEKAKTVNPLGYVVKPFSEQSLYAAIEIALHIHASQLKQQYPDLHFGKINNQLTNTLTQREFEVIELIYDGRTNHQIAERLLLSGNTVKKHINNAYLKMEVKTRTQALAHLRKLMSQSG